MFSNFVITALRNLLRHRMYAVINIGGLALGLAACLLIMLFVRSELGYDSWIPNSGQIHRLHTTANIPGRDPLRTVASSGPMARALKETFPEIEASTRTLYAGQRIFLDGNVYEESVTEVDPTFFQVFDLPLLQGDRNTALNDHNSIIISERTAQKYFGEEEALGQTITMCCYGPDSVNIDFRVTGIIADTPTNTHFYLDAVILIDENRYRHMPYVYESWTSLNTYTYLKFAEGSDPDGVAERLDWFLDEVMPKIVHGDHVVPPNSVLFDLFLMPIEDIHLNAAEQASSMSDIRPLGNMKLVVSFMLIALLILGIATINFLNLTTARFINRAREVSMRKVLGANRSEVVLQFLGETVLTSLLALGLSLLVVTLVLPWFNDFHSTQLKMDLLSGNGNLLMLLAITLVTGVLGGCYPSFYISRMQPAKVFRSANSAQQGRPGLFKNTLIVFQFSISIALLTITAVTWFQTDYARSADLGYESENRLVIHNLRESGAAEVQETLVSRLGNLRGVKAVSRSSEVPTRGNENNTAFMVKGKEHETGPQIINYISADYDFFDIYGIEPLTGRVFSRDFGADVARLSAPDAEINGSMVINEAAVSQLGFADAESALGQIISTDNFNQPTSFQVVGVIPNINNRSARYPAFSVIYWLRENRYSELTVHYGEDDPRELVSEIEAIWSELIPSVPFSHEIMEQMVRSLYLDDERQVTTISVFALLAIFISGLGLYAMASITVVKRTREIGLRKVMGARVREIIQLLLWQFSKPVVLANFLAWPVAWYFLDQWLSGFHYRISLSPVFFLLAGLVALLIAWVTVVGHAWRVARSNPISALRYE